MTKDKIDFSEYEYIMWVDASGDDGVKFEKDSSLCFTTACFITKVDDIQHNLNVLNEIKILSGRKEKDELKFTKLRRHPNYRNAIKKVADFKGTAALHTAFKQKLLEDEIYKNPEKRWLTSFTHSFPINYLLEHNEFRTKKVLVVIDRMKEAEMETVDAMVAANDNPKIVEVCHKVIFKDSKASGYELIQVADLMAGIGRSFFEETLKNPESIGFMRICKMCFYAIKNGKLKNSCSTLRIRRMKERIFAQDIKYIYPFLVRRENGEALFGGMRFFPLEISRNYIFFSCDKNKNKNSL